MRADRGASHHSTPRQIIGLGDRTRLRILNVLQDGELCVGQLVEILDVTQPRASQHLAYLRSAGLVTGRKEGLWIYYSLTEARSGFHKNLLDCLKQCFCEVQELKADDRVAAKVRKRGGCCVKPLASTKM